MRRRNELMDKLRVKILQDRENGLTYEQIQRKRGVSSRTIANLVKNGDPKRFCQQCGETDPEKLEEHHIDRINRPDDTVTLCASCHAKVTREQQRKRNREKESKTIIPEIVSSSNLPIVQTVPIQPQVTNASLRPLTFQEKQWMGRVICYGSSGIAIGEALFDKRLPTWAQIFIGFIGVGMMYAGSRIK